MQEQRKKERRVNLCTLGIRSYSVNEAVKNDEEYSPGKKSDDITMRSENFIADSNETPRLKSVQSDAIPLEHPP